jgi:hypothetical protein
MSSNISAMQYSTRNERVNAITEIPLNNLNASQQQTSTTAVPIWHNNTTKHPAISSILSTPAQQSRSPMFGESFLTLFQYTFKLHLLAITINNYLISRVCRWKGSIYKTLWKHFLIYCALYYLLTVVHKFALNGEQKK